MTRDPRPQMPQATQPTQQSSSRRTIPLAVAIVVMVAALFIVPRLLGGGEFRDAGDVQKQWATLSKDIAGKDIEADQVVQLDWVQYFDRQDQPGNFWLNAHYVEGDQVAQRWLLDDAQGPRPRRIEDAPRQVTTDDLSALQQFADAFSCPDGQFAGIAMRFLPDGKAMLMGGCGEGYNLAGEGYQHVQIDGQRYAVQSKDLKDNVHASLGLAKHLMPDGISLFEVTTVGHTSFGTTSQGCTLRVRTPLQKTTLTSEFLGCDATQNISGPLLDPANIDPQQAADAAAAAAQDAGYQTSPYSRLMIVPTSQQQWRAVVQPNQAQDQTLSYDMQGKRLG